MLLIALVWHIMKFSKIGPGLSVAIDECCIDDDNGDVESTNLQNALVPQLSHVHLFMQALLDLAIELWF